MEILWTGVGVLVVALVVWVSCRGLVDLKRLFMPKEYGYGQGQHSGSAPGFARETGAPKGVHDHEKARSKNVFDQAKKRAPNSGQTKGG